MSRAIDSIHLENPIFCFIFNQNLPLSPPPSSHCRYACLPEVRLNLHKYPPRYNQKFIIAILHHLVVVVVVVVVFVKGIRLKLCTMKECLNPACIDSIHLKNPIFTFIFNQNLPLSPPPSSHCRYACLPEVRLNLHKYPPRYNQKFIIAILHHLVVVVVVVVVFVKGIRLKLCTMKECLNPACIDSIHLKIPIFTFIFNHNLPLSPPPSSHC